VHTEPSSAYHVSSRLTVGSDGVAALSLKQFGEYFLRTAAGRSVDVRYFVESRPRFWRPAVEFLIADPRLDASVAGSRAVGSCALGRWRSRVLCDLQRRHGKHSGGTTTTSSRRARLDGRGSTSIAVGRVTSTESRRVRRCRESIVDYRCCQEILWDRGSPSRTQTLESTIEARRVIRDSAPARRSAPASFTRRIDTTERASMAPA